MWTVVYQVGAALLHMLRAGLPYTPLALDNVFLLRDRIALENMLSRKHRMTGCGCETWRGSSGHQRATASGSSERCFVHHVGQVIFALLTCHLRSQPEGNLPPCSPVNTLRSLKHLYSPSLLRLLSRTLAGGVSMAWGVMGGGGEGRVAVRAFQWETQWEQLDPCPEAEWPLSDSEEAFFLEPSPDSLPNGDPSSITVSHHQASLSVRSDTASVSVEQQQQQEREEVWGYPLRGNEGSSPMPDFLRDSSPVQLAQVVMMAAERVVALRGGGSLAEAVRTSPHRLIQHVMTAQKKHLKTK